MFGGEDVGEEGVREACEKGGVSVDWVDIAHAQPRDLLDDATYLPLLEKAERGCYDSAWAAFPCKAFCHSRWKEDGGAPPLYSCEHARGIPGLEGRWQVELLDNEELLYRTYTLLDAVAHRLSLSLKILKKVHPQLVFLKFAAGKLDGARGGKV